MQHLKNPGFFGECDWAIGAAAIRTSQGSKWICYHASMPTKLGTIQITAVSGVNTTAVLALASNTACKQIFGVPIP